MSEGRELWNGAPDVVVLTTVLLLGVRHLQAPCGDFNGSTSTKWRSIEIEYVRLPAFIAVIGLLDYALVEYLLETYQFAEWYAQRLRSPPSDLLYFTYIIFFLPSACTIQIRICCSTFLSRLLWRAGAVSAQCGCLNITVLAIKFESTRPYFALRVLLQSLSSFAASHL